MSYYAFGQRFSVPPDVPPKQDKKNKKRVLPLYLLAKIKKLVNGGTVPPKSKD